MATKEKKPKSKTADAGKPAKPKKKVDRGPNWGGNQHRPKHRIPVPPPQIILESDLVDLVDKQRRFVIEFFVDQNRVKAAERAGYSDPHIGHQLMHFPKVAAAIANIRRRLAGHVEVNATKVIQEMARVGFSDIRGVFNDDGSMKPMSEWSANVAASISSVEIEELYVGFGEERRQVGHVKKIRLWPKQPALDGLAKHLGLFVPEKVEMSGTLKHEHEHSLKLKDIPGLTVEQLRRIRDIRRQNKGITHEQEPGRSETVEGQSHVDGSAFVQSAVTEPAAGVVKEPEAYGDVVIFPGDDGQSRENV